MLLKKSLPTLLLIFSSLFLLSGCASKKEVQPNSFIKDVSLLKKSPINDSAYYYINDKIRLSNYNKIKVPPIRVIINEDNKDVDKELLSKVTHYFQAGLDKNLNNVIKYNKNSNTLILNVAIVNLDVKFDELKFYNYTPYSLAFKTVKRASGMEKQKVKVQLALKLIDKLTKETVAMVIDEDVAQEISYYEEVTFQDVQPALDKWINLYTLRLKEFNQGKYRKK